MDKTTSTDARHDNSLIRLTRADLEKLATPIGDALELEKGSGRSVNEVIHSVVSSFLRKPANLREHEWGPSNGYTN